MARKQKKEQPKPAELTSDKIKKGIIKLKRRIKELGEFDIETIQERWDPKTQALTAKINDTISEIFGYGTIEYGKYYISTLDTLPLIMGGGKDPIYKVREGYKKGIESAIVKLSSFKEILEEKIEDISQPADDTAKAYDFWMDIHPKIRAISKSRFETEHYADAVESALKEINSCVKDIVRRKTGKELMEHH